MLALVTFQAVSDVTALARSIIASLGSGDFAAVERQFDAAMSRAMPAGALATVWTRLQAQAGAFKGCSGDVRVRAIADKQMVITPCEFERGRIDVQFAFEPSGHIAGLVFRPASAPPVPYTLPSYATPSSYTERDTTIGSAEWALPGTLAMPAGAGPFPAVVLVHGFGPNDRDETVGANKPFKDLAVGLASRGIAVLRLS